MNLSGPFQINKIEDCNRILECLEARGAPERILVTLGSEGALLATRRGIIHCKIDPAHFTHKIISTTGCGDAATAGAIWSLLSSSDDESLLRCAVACGGAKTLSADPGAISLKSARRFVRYCVTTPLITR